MSVYRTTGQLDDRSAGAGSAQWLGVWAQGDPDKIPPGMVAHAENATFAERGARTRGGSMTPASFRASGLTALLYGSGVFSDPDGSEWLLLAAAEGVWRMRDGHTPVRIAIPEPLAARVEIVQAFNRVLLFRGSGRPWVWDGELRSAFQAIPQAATNDGTIPIPDGPDRPGLRPVLLNQRLYVPHGRRQLAASDILDYLRYDAAFADFNLAGPNDDQTTGLVAFSQSSLLVFNDQSVQLVSGLTGNLGAAAIAPINGRLGCVAGGTAAAIGADVFFLSDTGVYRVSQVVEGRLATAAQAVSEPIAPLIDRINFAAASGACAAVHDRYYWLAVPLDGASANDAILRYDTIAGAWQGVDRYPAGVRVSALHVTDFQGRKRLYAVDYANARVHLLEEGRADQIDTDEGATAHPIALRLLTRAETFNENQDKRIVRGFLQVKGWGASYRANALPDGVNTAETALPLTAPDRTKWKHFGPADYDPANPADNHAAPDRQDYSIDLAVPSDPGEAGLDFELEQAHREPFSVRRHGRHAQLEILNTAGTLAIVSTQLDADPGRRALRPT